ncbi:MrcB family domain-containing protein [Paenibacillus sp. YIM B09110]|uniref:MrcB family domain-containing protein n=1 Tax=Paenibacillus sp. YIM B09110 TaxID=3126102 RepID=UPI00301E60A1
MPLSADLSSIFRSKQKSYKMVLVLSIIDEYRATHNQAISLDDVAKRFLAYFQNNIEVGNKVDSPPSGVAASWIEFTQSQTKSLLYTPIKALSSILDESNGGITISFKSTIWDKLNEETMDELQRYARVELDNYNSNLAAPVSLNQSLTQIMNGYISAKTQPFSSHQLGTLLRQTLPTNLKKLSFIDDNYKVQGSIGQGNWANIPWLAVLDKRITDTTQHGEYVVYLFAEDMSSVYLTLAQGVTVPLKDRGKREGYQYLQQKVQEIRELLPLENMQKDEHIHLTSSGLGRDYQVSTIAYLRYERNHIPDEEQLIADLENMMANYKLYVEKMSNPVSPSIATFKYTMAHLYLSQGIIAYLGKEFPTSIALDELTANQSSVLISGDDVKHPKERIQHIGRALLELGLIRIDNGHYSFTPLGIQYANAMDSNPWRLSSEQVELLRQILADNNNDVSSSSNLIKAINMAIIIARNLSEFSLEQFNEKFISEMQLQEDWGKVTQENRSRFMLNWLEELAFVQKQGDKYIIQGDKENETLDTLTVSERIEHIKDYIAQKGFHYPGSLIENLYLSFKTKPFVILAGVSGTGKTKLVKLFAEALGATSLNKQFSLIPVRPDWSDPSDLLGYKDLSGAYRPGQLADVLVEASKSGNRHKSYFICLDEMNLARVEHYFSDMLSIIETQEWQNEHIVTSPLIHKDSLRHEDQSLYGNLSLPDNVYLIGTVNMDETTHPFSKKVLDRANTIEFNYINLGQFPDEVGFSNVAGASQAGNSFLRSEYLQLIDVYQDYKDLVQKTTEKLVKINSILEEIHSHVGFRIRDAVCFYMIYNERFQLLSEDAAFDLQLLQKILPRVQGSSSSVKRVLLQLMQGALGKTLPIAELMEDSSDLYMKWSASQTEEAAKHPQTARKIAFMLRRLEEDGFTSYWLS